MSFLWRLLTHRADNPTAGFPVLSEIGADPYPEIETEGEENAEIDAVEARQALDEAPVVMHLTELDFARAARALSVDIPTVRAVAEVEAAGRGFLPDGRPSILYEAHVFGRLTNHRHGDRDRLGRALSARAWDRSLYGPAGAWQHDGRLLPAADLDWEAAHRAASWGAFQILGTNHVMVGYATIHGFVSAMQSGASAHLDTFVTFVKANRLDGPLQRREWAVFARGYNGSGFAANQYDIKLAAAYRKWAAT